MICHCYSSYRNKYRIYKIIKIKLSSKQFLPCGRRKQNSKQVLPNTTKTLTHSSEKGSVSYIYRQDGARARQRVCCKPFTVLLNPFLFIRGLSCPCSVQTSLTQKCLKLMLHRFPYNLLHVSCGDIVFKKPRSNYGLEIRPKSAFTAFRALLPSANYSAEWSGPVWQPTADIKGHLAHFSLNLKRAKQLLLSAVGCHTRPSKFKF